MFRQSYSTKNESDADQLKVKLLNVLGLESYQVNFYPSDSIYSPSQTIHVQEMTNFSSCSVFTNGYFDKERSAKKINEAKKAYTDKLHSYVTILNKLGLEAEYTTESYVGNGGWNPMLHVVGTIKKILNKLEPETENDCNTENTDLESENAKLKKENTSLKALLKEYRADESYSPPKKNW